MEVTNLATQELTVSLGSSLDTKELVKQAIDIVDLVGSHMQLRRQGRNYVGLCPWHDDTRPSLQVNPERQSFKCWVCDIGGDIFTFVMKIEGVTFPEALAMLADRAGIPMKPRRGESAGPGGDAQDKRTLYAAMVWAESKYHDCLLRSPEAEPARQYLQQRRITPESIDKFHLGFAPNSRNWILQQASGSQYTPKVLETIGLVARGDQGGSLYDRFRGRVLFSIRDPQNRPVGFGGRILPESGASSPAKYVNSPETPLFSKSNLLYGLDVARDALRKSRTALVMEGYTDCIFAHQHGFEDAVAVLGTALGERHVRILKRFADRIVLVLDGDEAGQRRANEVLELFVAEQVDLRIVTLPEGMDPCDFLTRHGSAAFADLLDTRAVDALEHAFGAATRGVDLDGDVHGSSQALEYLVSIVAKAPRLRSDTTREDRFREEKILQRLAARFRVPEEVVRRRLTALRRSSRRKPAMHVPPQPEASRPEADVPVGTMDPWQRELLEILLQHPELVPAARAVIQPEQLEFEPCRRIYETCCRLSDRGSTPTFDCLMLEFDDPALKSLLVELDEKGRAKATADPGTLLEELIGSFQSREAERQYAAAEGKLRERRLDPSEQLDLLRKIQRQATARQRRARGGISDPTDGMGPRSG